MQTLSSGPSFCASPMKKPLLRMLWWVRVAPLGAPVVPLVNWMLMGSSNWRLVRQLDQTRALGGGAQGRDLGEGDGARPGTAHLDHGLEPGQAGAAQLARVRGGELGGELAQHGKIVAGLEAAGGHQRPAADLVQRVVQLVGAVGRVDVDQDQAGLGGGELGDHPLGIVGRPDADPVAGLEAQRQEPGGEGVDLGVQLGVGPADRLLAHDQGGPVGPAGGGTLEVGADGLADQGHVAHAVHVAEPVGHARLPRLGMTYYRRRGEAIGSGRAARQRQIDHGATTFH